MTLSGHVALVTGSGNLRGIGRGIAQALAEQGADVVVHHVDGAEEAEEVAGDLRRLGVETLVVRADITKPDDVAAMFTAVVDRFGRLDILVNNAGVAVWEAVLDISETGFDRTMSVNVKGTLDCARHAARIMVERGTRGRIINVASAHAQRPMPLMGVYGASKASMDQLTQSLALELAPHGITVNQLWPGFVDTDINKAKPELATEEGRRALLATIPLGEAATPADVGAAAAYLASPAGRVVSGAVIKIDGGQHLRCI